MVRTILTIPEEDKRWFDHYSRLHHQPTAQTIRLALKQFKQRASEKTRSQALTNTAGLLKDRVDSVKFVRQLRNEWTA